MKKFLSDFISIFTKKDNEYNLFENTESIEQLATRSAINRRRNSRVNYPHIGAVGELPAVSINDQIIQVKDISTGGLCLIDNNNIVSRSIGEEFVVSLSWPDTNVSVQSTLVGFTDERLHVQFQDLDTRIHVRLSMILKPGFLGRKFHKVPDFKESIDAEEMWIGPTGEWLTFLKNYSTSENNGHAEMNYGKACLLLSMDAPPRYNESTSKYKKGQVIPKAVVNELLIVLSNFQNPSIRVKKLIEKLNQQYSEL